MKKELIIGVVCAVAGSGATLGFDILKSKLFKQDDPLSQGVTELSHISKELILEQKSLNDRIGELASKAAVSPEIKVEINDIINRVNNIVQTTVKFESKSRDVSGIANSVKSRNDLSYYNSNADIVLPKGRAITICGNENTLGVMSDFTENKIKIKINDATRIADVGTEYIFKTPTGSGFLSYLGKNSNQYEFRLICDAQLKKV